MTHPTRCLIFDPFAGISGDMILGALIDLGLEQQWLVELVGSLPVQAKLSVDSVTRGTLMAKAVRVELTGSEKPRRLADLLQIVEQAAIGSAARQTAAATFRRLAEVEGALHGLPADEVHFHEVGGDDAIVDIVGACAAIDRLEIHQCYTRPVSVGHGWVTAQHGPLPVPAPATLRLLEGLPVRDSTIGPRLTPQLPARRSRPAGRGRRLADRPGGHRRHVARIPSTAPRGALPRRSYRRLELPDPDEEGT